jgi:hypothetical protein
MNYNIAAFARFLGNPLDNTHRTNIMFFRGGKQICHGITTLEDIPAAEAFVGRFDSRYNLYLNLNVANMGVYGKPRDSDIPQVKNLYIDVDAIKADDMRKHPATEAEIMDIPIDEICDVVRDKCGYNTYVDMTGNGFRVVVPVHGATADDQKRLVAHLSGMFPGYIDRNVVDPSRITGVPGTMNLKTEVSGRPNRRRDSFTGHIRLTADPPTYTEEELATILKATSGTPGAKDRRTRGAKINPQPICGSVQEILNEYLLKCSREAPWAIRIIENGPPDGNGFLFDGFICSEIYNKVGDAPRVAATILKVMWGPSYSPRATQKAWDDCVNSGVGAWSKRTVQQKFGNDIFGDE